MMERERRTGVILIMTLLFLSSQSCLPEPTRDPYEGADFEDIGRKIAIDEARSAVADCVVDEGEGYSWEHTDISVESGSGGTVCQYSLVIQSAVDDKQYTVLYEEFDNDAMEWKEWQARELPGRGEHTYSYSFTRYEDGAETYSLGTRLLVLQRTQECYQLTISNEANQIVWEENAQDLGNPCE